MAWLLLFWEPSRRHWTLIIIIISRETVVSPTCDTPHRNHQLEMKTVEVSQKCPRVEGGERAGQWEKHGVIYAHRALLDANMKAFYLHSKASVIPRLSPSRSALAFLLFLLQAAGGAVTGDGLVCTGCGNCQIFSACKLVRCPKVSPLLFSFACTNSSAVDSAHGVTVTRCAVLSAAPLAAQGSFTHSSSSDAGYGNNWNCEWIIAPADRQSGVEVRFGSFSTEGQHRASNSTLQ